MLLGLFAALAASVCYGVATVLQAVSARAAPHTADVDPRLLLRLLRRIPFLGGVLLGGDLRLGTGHTVEGLLDLLRRGDERDADVEQLHAEAVGLDPLAGFPQQVGAKGAEMLLTRLADGNSDIPTQLDLIQPQLKIRSSTATEFALTPWR